MFKTPDPVAFSIFGLDIRWYGILVVAGILIATLWTCKRAPLHDMTADDLIDVILFSVPLGIIGARLYYVIFNWDYYAGDLFAIINMRAGGLAIHGGLLLGFLTAFLVCRRKGLSFLNVLDLAVPGIAAGQAIGRWGNFFNGEAHGGPTDLPWGVIIDGVSYHPTFLYESVWCLILFFILWRKDNRREFTGQTFCLYAMLYSAERILVEALRTDSLMIGPFKQAQVLSLCVIIFCAVLYSRLKKKGSGGDSPQDRKRERAERE